MVAVQSVSQAHARYTQALYSITMRSDEHTVFKLNNGWGVAGDTWPQISSLFGDGASDGGTLHLTLVVHDDTGVVCEPQNERVNFIACKMS
jgi:hypothetical protein